MSRDPIVLKHHYDGKDQEKRDGIDDPGYGLRVPVPGAVQGSWFRVQVLSIELSRYHMTSFTPRLPEYRYLWRNLSREVKFRFSGMILPRNKPYPAS